MRRIYPVFISHSARDDVFVDFLATHLEANGIGAWKDNDVIRVGERWVDPAEKGIRECKVFILVISPESLESQAVRQEITWAEGYNRPLIPVLLNNPQTWDGLSYNGDTLRSYTYADCREWVNTQAINENELKRLIDGINSYRLTWYGSFINSATFSDEEEKARVAGIKEMILEFGDRALPQLAERVFRGRMSLFIPPESEIVIRGIAEIGGDFAVGILHLALEAYGDNDPNTPIIIEALGKVGDRATEHILYIKLGLYQRLRPELVEITEKAINEARGHSMANRNIRPNTTIEDLAPFMGDE